MKRFLNPKLILAFMAVALVVTMVATVVVFRSLPIPARAASNQMATIGMPFNGKWAYYQNVNPPYTDANSSHPTVHWTDASTHYLWGDWATDIYGATGVSVNLRVSGATGALSFGWFTTSSDKCGGSSRGVIIKVDNTEIGRLYVTHLQNPASMINAPTNGMKLGEVRDGTCNPGHHTHIELKSSVSNTKACYTDHGNPGKSLVEGDSLGIVGDSGATAIRTACSTSSSGGAYSRPAVLQYGTEMDVYKQGSNNDFWKNTWQPSNNSWSGWVDMTGASFQGDPAAIKYNSEMDVFGIGTNGQVYKNTWQPSNNSWSGWNILGSGGTFVGTPSAIQYGSSEMDVYARATNNQIYKETWNGTSWSGWNSLGGSIAGNPKAMIYNGSEMDVWARGTDGALWKDG